MAVLHKADFIYENITQRHRLFRVFSKEVRSNSFLLITFLINNHHQHHCTCSTKAPPRITLEEVNLAFLSGTFSTQFLIIPFKLFYGLIVLSQVVHNRGHDFSKRFTLQGCTMFATRTVRPITCALALFLGKPAGWERCRLLPR